MAIAAIVAHCLTDSLQGLSMALQEMPVVVEARAVTADRIAAAVEASSDLLPMVLKEIQELPDLLQLEVVFINYEDDLDAQGEIKSPPLADIIKLSR